MSWNHSSRLVLGGVAVLVVLAAVGAGSAVTVTQEQVPPEAEVDSSVTVTVEFEDLFANESSWALEGTTDLQDASWTVEFYQRDQVVATQEVTGQNVYYGPINESNRDAPDRVRVQITGAAPAIEEYSYAENETFEGVDLLQVYDDGVNWSVIGEWEVGLYSQESLDARSALDSANETIQSERESDTDVSAAESTFDDAVSAYNSGELDQAITLADQAAQEAEDGGSTGDGDGNQSDDGSQSDDGGQTDSDGQPDGSDTSGTDGSQNGTDSSDDSGASGGSDDGGGGLLSIVVALLLLGLLGGGGFWYYKQQQGPSRDPLG